MSNSGIGLIVLAAGSASRMGLPKQLLEVHGRPLVRLVVENALGSVCRPVVVVLGANAPEIKAALAGTGAETVENPRWQEGMGTSIQAGLRALEAHGADGAILMLADQPLIGRDILNRLVKLYRQTGQPIVTAEYAGTVGVPVLFRREYFPQLHALEPDKGCKGVIMKNRAHAAGMACPEAEVDIDTPEDYRRVLEMAGTKDVTSAAASPCSPQNE